jgi:hypothetical protein
MTTPPTRPHARHPSERPPVLIRLVQTSDLPDGINALASADGGTIIVRAGLDQPARRLAVREVLARRFPGLLVFPVMAAMQARRAVVAVADAVSRLVQSAASLSRPANPVAVLLAGAAVATAATVGGTVLSLTGRAPHGQGAAWPAPASAPRHRGQAAALARHAARSGGRSRRAAGQVPAPQPGITPVAPPSGSAPRLPSLPVPVPSVSVSASLPPIPPPPIPPPPIPPPPIPLPPIPPPPIPLPPIPPPPIPPIPLPVPSPGLTCLRLGPLDACVSR